MDGTCLRDDGPTEAAAGPTDPTDPTGPTGPTDVTGPTDPTGPTEVTVHIDRTRRETIVHTGPIGLIGLHIATPLTPRAATVALAVPATPARRGAARFKAPAIVKRGVSSKNHRASTNAASNI